MRRDSPLKYRVTKHHGTFFVALERAISLSSKVKRLSKGVREKISVLSVHLRSFFRLNVLQTRTPLRMSNTEIESAEDLFSKNESDPSSENAAVHPKIYRVWMLIYTYIVGGISCSKNMWRAVWYWPYKATNQNIKGIWPNSSLVKKKHRPVILTWISLIFEG